jgi:predicted AlkP superfamily phosphohydrolase/phosphomutase
MRLKRLALAAFVGAVVVVSCRTVAPPAEPPRRVVVLSLDGAGAQELWRLHEAGAFGPDGFERLLREGEVARRLVPVNPALTAVNHISLASGFAPAATGIVSNSFHLAGQPIGKRADGFLTASDSEFLWQAARRQGKRAGVVAWPGGGAADAATGSDWALLWNSNVLRPAQIVAIAASAWRTAEAGVAAPVASFSPPRRVGVELRAETSFPAQTLEVWAVDRRDDGVVAYDAVAVRDAAGGAAPVLLEPGGSGRLIVALPGEASPVVEWLELLRLDAGGDASLYFGRVLRNLAYPPDYERRLAESEVLWPPPPDDDALEATWEGKPGLTLEQWCAQSDRFARYFIDAFLVGLRTQEWDLAMGYVPTIDESAHQLLLADPRQPEWSAERQRDFAAARDHVWQSADREVARLLAALDPRTTTFILVSDHGLAPVHTAIDANAVLRAAGLLRTGDDHKLVESQTQMAAFTSGGTAHLYLNLAGREPGGIVEPADRDALLARAREIFSSLRSGGESPIARILAPADLAALGLDHRHAGDLVLLAAPGYWFATSKPMASQPLFPTPAYGQHGYFNDDPRMHAIYLAWGRGIEPGRLESLSTTEVAGRVARALGIDPPRRTVERP